MMRKWVESFDIKKDTLVDLRKEFAVDALAIENILVRLLAEPQSEEEVHKELTVLEKHWKKVENNYKIGNYFY